MLRAADRYAYTGCGSTAYSVGTVYGGKGHLYTSGVCPGLLATPCIASLATPRRLAGDHLAPHWRSPYASLAITLCLTGDHLVDDALLEGHRKHGHFSTSPNQPGSMSLPIATE